MKGVGWIPAGSLESEKNRKAMEIVSEKKYRQHPDKLKYSILMDSMPMVLATSNAKTMDEVSTYVQQVCNSVKPGMGLYPFDLIVKNITF